MYVYSVYFTFKFQMHTTTITLTYWKLLKSTELHDVIYWHTWEITCTSKALHIAHNAISIESSYGSVQEERFALFSNKKMNAVLFDSCMRCTCSSELVFFMGFHGLHGTIIQCEMCEMRIEHWMCMCVTIHLVAMQCIWCMCISDFYS